MNIWHAVGSLALVACCWLGNSWGWQESPRTVAESSGFLRTSTSQESQSFLEELTKEQSLATLESIGETIEGRSLMTVRFAKPGTSLPLPPEDPRLVVLLLGNIHSGECDGKEALLAMVRDWCKEPPRDLLERLVVVFLPNYNADGNDRFGKLHRPGQGGPVEGMGVRENAQGFDLNRDFVKLQSPEARSLVTAIDRWQVDALIDLHTTNGSLHRYPLTYDVPHNPAAPADLVQWLHTTLLPEATKRLKAEGIDSFYYGNFSPDHKSWESFGFEPRYSTEYMGLRGRIGILSESYSYAGYQERIDVSYRFTRHCLDLLAEHHQELSELIREIDNRHRLRQERPYELPIQAVESGSGPIRSVLGYSYPESESKEQDGRQPRFPSPRDRDRRDSLLPVEYRVELRNQYRATRTIQLPDGYYLPDSLAWAVELLRMHGVDIYRCDSLPLADVEGFEVGMVSEVREQPFQGLSLKRIRLSQQVDDAKARGAWLQQFREEGGFWIPTRQPLGALLGYLLEAESEESVGTWGYLDGYLAAGRPFPIVRVIREGALLSQLPTERPKWSGVPRKEPLRLETLFQPGRMIQPAGKTITADAFPRWRPGSAIYEMKRGPGAWVAVEAASGAMEPMEWTNRMAARLKQFSGLEGQEVSDSIRSENYHPGTGQAFASIAKDLYLYDHRSGEARRLTESPEVEEELPSMSPDGTAMVFVQENDLHWIDLKSGQQRRITEGGSATRFQGKLNWVYQEEIYGRGNYRGYWWDPTGKYLCWLRLDSAGMDRHWLTDSNPALQTQESEYYPQPGRPNPVATLWLYDTTSQTHRQISPQEYSGDSFLLVRVDWKPDGSLVTFQVQDRVQSWLELWGYRPGDEVASKWFRESSRAWMEPLGPPHWLADGSYYWLTDQPLGFRHLARVDPEGGMSHPQVDLPREIEAIHHVSADGLSVLVEAADEDPVGRHLWSIAFPEGKGTRLTALEGTHQVSVHPDGEYFFDLHSSLQQSPTLYLRQRNGHLGRAIEVPKSDRHRTLEEVSISRFTLPTEDGASLQGLLMLPADWTAKGYQGKLPVIYHVYAGPRTPTVKDSWGNSLYWWHRFLAQEGYAVVYCDHRAARGRSIADTWGMHRHLGEIEMADTRRVVEWIGQQPWADRDRVGIWGWSYGGYMTAYAMTHSEWFRAGIAGAPVTDWRLYDSIYTERLMDTPEANPVGYSRSSVLEAADRLHGRLMLIHGELDDNVHPSNSLQLAARLQALGTPFDLMIYPGNRHAISNPAQKYHLHRTMLEFWDRHLRKLDPEGP